VQPSRARQGVDSSGPGGAAAPPGVRRPVIGLLLNTLFDGYEEAIWRGVLRAAEELDVDVLGFLGGALGEALHQSFIYDLVHEGNVDGVVVISPAVGFHCGPAGIAALLERLGLPAVSISERVPGVPSVLLDNRTSMDRVVEHLVTVHGRRRIAFLRGPPSSTEGEVRFQAYRDTLARLEVPFDPALVVEGDHWPASGIHGVRTLLDERRASFDALASSNDLMAIAAMDELRRRGLRVPGDVAVTGFDDVVDASSTTPRLTTAHQPLHEMAREAIRRVLARIRGEPVGAEVELPAQLQLRQSCGCSSLEEEGEVGPVPGAEAASPEALAADLTAAFPEFGARLGVPGWAAELVAALAPPSGGDPGFLRTLERLLSRGLEVLPEPTPWTRVVRELMARARRGAGAEQAARLAALSEGAMALVGSMARSAELARRMRTDLEARVLHRMIEPFPLPDEVFIRNLFGALDVLGVRSFFICRYLGSDLREARLLVHHDLDGVAELDPSPAPFAAQQLIPGRFSPARRKAHVVLPIQAPDGPIGFALCGVGQMGSSGYEMIMHQISVVLSVNGLMAEVQDQHRQLLETARQAGMAEVAVGALHNIGNLLNSVNVSADEIRAAAAAATSSNLLRATALLTEHAGDLPGFFAQDARAPLLPTYLDKAVQAMWRELERIQAESQELQDRTALVRDSIRALQDHARVGADHPVRETVELPVLVRSALEIQQAQLARWGVQVRQELEALPPLVTQRSKLVHVLVNLVKNAVEAMRGTPEGQRVLLLRGVQQKDGRVRLEVTDSGEGIAPADLARIFSYGFTTKRDGYGFGLYTCAHHMKTLGGSIAVTSDGLGKGATFTLLLEAGGAG
jgi:DNA-binding LacI/PurR family transcriptional regulator/signal transduction histidine kinase